MTLPLATWLLGAVLFQASTLPATAPAIVPASADGPASADVAALLAQLGDDDADRRDAAQRRLLVAGDDVLPQLRAVRDAARDADVQLRLDTLLVQIQERVDVGASRVTLTFADAPLNVVLDALERQAHADFGDSLADEFGGQAVPRVTLDVRDVSFWQAIDAIQSSANVVFVPQQDGWRASRNFGQGMQVRGSESGAFLVQPTMASYQRSISYARDMGDGGEHFSLQFQALAEPKIRLASGQGTVRVDRAVDSNGNDLLGAQRAQQVSTGNGQNAIGCAVQLKYPKDPGATIREVSGTLTFTMARRVESLASDDAVGQGKLEATFDATRITIEATDAAAPRANRNANNGNPNNAQANAGAGVDVRVTIDGPASNALAQRLQANAQQQVRLLDARGNLMRVVNFDHVRNEPQASEFRLGYLPTQPQNSRGPYKLRLEVPTGFREIEVPFTMRDLKMP